MSNIEKNTACLNKCVNDVTRVSNVKFLNCKDAQLLVNELNSNATECISNGCSKTAASHKQDIGRAKRRPWWSISTRLSTNRKSLWYGIWISCNKPLEGFVYMAVSSPKQDIGRQRLEKTYI